MLGGPRVLGPALHIIRRHLGPSTDVDTAEYPFAVFLEVKCMWNHPVRIGLNAIYVTTGVKGVSAND